MNFYKSLCLSAKKGEMIIQKFRPVVAKFWRKIKKRNDRTLRYWEKSAKKNPYHAICTSVQTKEEFNNKSASVLFESKENFKDKIVLDLCCGLGRIAKFIVSDVKQYIGVDFSPIMIELARKRFEGVENVKFILNDGKTLKEIEDGSIDVCVCELGFQHLNKDVSESYVNEVHRVLKGDGVFLAQVPRLDYYKNKAFAFTLEETKAMFEKFSIEFLDYEHQYAYYLLRAVK